MGTSSSSPVVAPAPAPVTAKAPAPKPAAKRPAAPKISEADAALLSLKTQRNNLFDAAERNENVRTRLIDEAKRALALSLGNTVVETPAAASTPLDGSTLSEAERSRQKQKALALMRRAKHHEAQVQAIQAMFDNIDTTIDALEAGEVHKRVVAALDTGKTQLQRLNFELRDAEKIMDDMREAVADARDITAHLTEPLDALKAEEENEAAEAELAAMMGLSVTTTTTTLTVKSPQGKAAVAPTTTTTTTTTTIAESNSETTTAAVGNLTVPSGALVASPVTDTTTTDASPVAAAQEADDDDVAEEHDEDRARQLVAA